MAGIKVETTGGGWEALFAAIAEAAGEKSLPRVSKVLDVAAHGIAEAWRQAAMGGPIPGASRRLKPSSEHAKSVKTRKTGEFQREIYSDSPEAGRAVKGRPRVDMKTDTRHLSGPRSRVSAEGHAYLIVPMRWGTPGTRDFYNTMPITVYEIVKKFVKMNTETSASDPAARQTRNAQGGMAGRASYNKGYGRLAGAQTPDDLNMAGMARVADDTGKDRAGGYFTFRVISAKQRMTNPGAWVIPERPPLPFTEMIKADALKDLEALARQAAAEDLMSL